MGGEGGAAVLDALLGYGPVEIFPDRAGEFRLVEVGFDHLRVVADPLEGTVEDLRADSPRDRPAAEILHPGIEILGRMGRAGHQEEGGRKKMPPQQIAHHRPCHRDSRWVDRLFHAVAMHV